MRVQLPRILSNLLLAGVSLLAALSVAELALRVLVPPSRGYYVLVPGGEWTITTGPEGTPGAQVNHVRVNSAGIRGRSFGDDRAEYRMLAVGGSTTECGGQDDAKVWTHLLETGLHETADGRQVWVGNVGHDGASTRDHVLVVKYLLRQYPHIDVVVALVGVNDMVSGLRQGWQYQLPVPVTEPSGENQQLRHAFTVLPGRVQDPIGYDEPNVAWYKATALWQLARRARLIWQWHQSFRPQDGGMSGLERARLRRQTVGPLIDSLPPLERPLVEYRRNLNAMVDLAAAAGAHMVFVTHPSVWRGKMSDVEQRRLWLGWVGANWSGSAYYTPGALSRAMASYNGALLDVCRQRGLHCVDAARALPHDTTAFMDDVHFTTLGSQLLAEALVASFREHPPFRRLTKDVAAALLDGAEESPALVPSANFSSGH